MIEIGEIEGILGGGEREEGDGIIIEERGSGSKMMAGEGGGTRGEEDKVQVGAGTGVEREGEMKKGLSMLLQEVSRTGVMAKCPKEAKLSPSTCHPRRG